jgi:DNA helicase-2/ATP-dependent DNA helicase PcrA
MPAGTENNFTKVFDALNPAQRQAVEQTDGPLLVLAGPGTGKTQLLSARVAQILRTTDTLPQNILCLTFTESGADNMRQRLTSFIGPDAYNVSIATYHAFGGDLITRFPEYFAETRLESPVDDLGKHEIVGAIVEKMSYLNPLKSTQHHLGDLITTLSEVKRGLLDGKDLRVVVAENTAFITAASPKATEIFDGLARMPGTYAKAAPYYEQLLSEIEKLTLARHSRGSGNPNSKKNSYLDWIPASAGMTSLNSHLHGNDVATGHYGSLGQIAVQELSEAIEQAGAQNSTKLLTAWKNKWLVKDSANNFAFAGEQQNKRIAALAEVLKAYQKELETRGLFDFDDMILRAIGALEANDNLRFSLQEQYLYILLDEFQDTNAAQLKLVELLTNNPVSEGRPNVMAVGDDKQAIYAFQGAQYSNMWDFHEMYRGVTTVNLTENYRSHESILHVAGNISGQISASLSSHFPKVDEKLIAANDKITVSDIERREFLSDAAQYDWMANKIAELINKGTDPRHIAVLAPKHRYLEPLVPYLNKLHVPVRYEKRENIFDAKVIRELLSMAKLVLALHENNDNAADAIWPEILSYDFCGIPTSKIWELSWHVSDSRGKLTWSKILLADPTCRHLALLFLTLANRAENETLENMLDFLIGTSAPEAHEKQEENVRSPVCDFYTSHKMREKNPEIFYETLSNLTVLREKLRDHQAASNHPLTLQDLLDFVRLYESAGAKLINTSPYNQHKNAVQLMTVFKAKGLEFDHVFIPACQDNVWGESSGGDNNKLTLPPNLAPIRHAGASEDERLRIFFVAITRAKYGLYFTSFSQSWNGKATKRLKYLQEAEQPDGSFKSMVLPEKLQLVQQNDNESLALESLETNWHSRHLASLASTTLRDLLQQRIADYRLSPTHLNTFTDLIYAGPDTFFFNTLLRFPGAPTPDGEFGNAMHETLQWLQEEFNEHEKLPNMPVTEKYFLGCLRQKKLENSLTDRLAERGNHALRHFLTQHPHFFKKGDRAEYNFYHEGVFVGNAHMSGKIDRMEIDSKNKKITVVDYKTGEAFGVWKSDPKLHKYRRQLYCYKLLIENSHTFKGYRVEQGRLEFLEPDEHDHMLSLSLNFDDNILEETKSLLAAIWQSVQTLNFPDISCYPQTLPGIRDFEKSLTESQK